ncbi:MAG TPA: pitrilysin family protein [Polyangiaceae bacterium]|nr:pitrilysin family protein [Polyangiaceae bacterium]
MNYRSFSALAALALGCGAAPPPPAPAPATPPSPATLTPTAATSKGVEPPASGIAPSAPFPGIAHRELENGLGLRVVERHVHPIIELRLVVRTGSAADGEKPGLASVAGELLKAGGAGGMSPQKLVERAEALGSSLDVVTDRDSTRISLSVTTGDLDPALEILAALALKPAFAPVEFNKLRTREIERVKSSARGSAAWAASMVLYRELYELPTGIHPYSRYDALPAEFEKISLQDCRAWHKTNFAPGNAALIVAGDVSPEAVEAGAKKWFGAWKGESPPNISFSQPFPPKEREVYLVDRPGSAQSQVYVGMLGSDRTQPDFPALSAANQILGGGVSSRLFLDVREKRSLAYSTGSSVSDPAHGPGSVVLSAGTQTAKAPDAVAALLENLQALAEKPAQPAELESATRFLNDSFVFKLETVGSVAELTSKLYILGLGDDYFDEYRKAIRSLELTPVSTVAARYYQKTPIIVVAGDAATLGPELAKFGPVAVVDPEHGFSLKKSYPKKP